MTDAFSALTNGLVGGLTMLARSRRFSVLFALLTSRFWTTRPFVRFRVTGPCWYGKWSRNGTPVVRALGRAWVEEDGEGGWRRRRGRPTDDAPTEAQAAERMLVLVREHHADETLLDQDAEERRRNGTITSRDQIGATLQTSGVGTAIYAVGAVVCN